MKKFWNDTNNASISVRLLRLSGFLMVCSGLIMLCLGQYLYTVLLLAASGCMFSAAANFIKCDKDKDLK